MNYVRLLNEANSAVAKAEAAYEDAMAMGVEDEPLLEAIYHELRAARFFREYDRQVSS